MNSQKLSGRKDTAYGDSVTLPMPTVRRRAGATGPATPTGTVLLLRPHTPHTPTHPSGCSVVPLPMATPVPRADASSRNVSTVRSRPHEARPGWLLFVLGLSIALFTTSVVRLFQAASSAHTTDTAAFAGR